MPILYPKVAHRLNITLDAKLVKQQIQNFKPKIQEAIEANVKKLKARGFIHKEQHPNWLTNIVPIIMKNGKVRVSINFRDLNDACPKNDFPLPITDVIINMICGFERMSFIDGFSRYN